MGKKKIREHTVPDADIGMDMTPMIDIVFQMIMFFIIITDFSQEDIALLELPWSTVGVEDDGEDENRIIINITSPIPTKADPKKWDERRRKQANQILVKGKPKDFIGIYRFLESNGVQNKRYRDPENQNLSTRSILIRCDGAQAFDYVKAILQICANPEIAIYKIELATSEQIKEE
ncbi:MAG: biopolymer transport protein ExbD [Planctomycetota bacterium]